MKILVLNAGSSSQKSCLYDFEDGKELGLDKDVLPEALPEPIWKAQIDWSAPEGHAVLSVQTSQGAALHETYVSASKQADTLKALQTLWSESTQVINNPQEIDIVGHRIVHGGEKYQDSTWINADVKAAIAQLAKFAPVHNPANLEGIAAVENILGPDIPQVAVFDTAFHSHLLPAVYTYPGPYEWLQLGIRRYGFHGISHQYCARRAAQILGRDLNSLKLITCHLGNGCSLAAIREGHSIDTTMGFTPLEGLMMGTRSGSVDPGILIHLLRQSDYTADRLDRVLNHQSGLLGISGVSNDLRQVVSAMEQDNDRAKLAFAMFVHRLQTQIGAMLASLGGMDALVFTGGIGENSPAIRAETCKAFEFLNLSLDLSQNEACSTDREIAQPDSKVSVLVIHTQEDWAIAQECHRLASC
jgi:acetate kinase